ncbi:MAG: hypothetical protein ACP6IP_08320 [Candidatus Njordarchaeia archaeon]
MATPWHRLLSVPKESPRFIGGSRSILDEPTANLPPSRKRQIINTLSKLKKNGKLVIVATHDLDFAEKICDTVLVLKDGKFVKEGNREIITEKVLEEN